MAAQSCEGGLVCLVSLMWAERYLSVFKASAINLQFEMVEIPFAIGFTLW
jgi:hypothetical protein